MQLLSWKKITHHALVQAKTMARRRKEVTCRRHQRREDKKRSPAAGLCYAEDLHTHYYAAAAAGRVHVTYLDSKSRPPRLQLLKAGAHSRGEVSGGLFMNNSWRRLTGGDQVAVQRYKGEDVEASRVLLRATEREMQAAAAADTPRGARIKSGRAFTFRAARRNSRSLSLVVSTAI